MTRRRLAWGSVYIAHRRAYTPRPLVMALLSGAVAVAFVRLVDPPPALEVLSCVAIALALALPRWWIWKWRHPTISREEYAADMREAMRRAARWN